MPKSRVWEIYSQYADILVTNSQVLAVRVNKHFVVCFRIEEVHLNLYKLR